MHLIIVLAANKFRRLKTQAPGVQGTFSGFSHQSVPVRFRGDGLISVGQKYNYYMWTRH